MSLFYKEFEKYTIKDWGKLSSSTMLIFAIVIGLTLIGCGQNRKQEARARIIHGNSIFKVGDVVQHRFSKGYAIVTEIRGCDLEEGWHYYVKEVKDGNIGRHKHKIWHAAIMTAPHGEIPGVLAQYSPRPIKETIVQQPSKESLMATDPLDPNIFIEQKENLDKIEHAIDPSDLVVDALVNDEDYRTYQSYVSDTDDEDSPKKSSTEEAVVEKNPSETQKRLTRKEIAERIKDATPKIQRRPLTVHELKKLREEKRNALLDSTEKFLIRQMNEQWYLVFPNRPAEKMFVPLNEKYLYSGVGKIQTFEKKNEFKDGNTREFDPKLNTRVKDALVDSK